MEYLGADHIVPLDLNSFMTSCQRQMFWKAASLRGNISTKPVQKANVEPAAAGLDPDVSFSSVSFWEADKTTHSYTFDFWVWFGSCHVTAVLPRTHWDEFLLRLGTTGSMWFHWKLSHLFLFTVQRTGHIYRLLTPEMTEQKCVKTTEQPEQNWCGGFILLKLNNTNFNSQWMSVFKHWY